VTLFVTYLRCELRHRPWQAVITAAGLALGTGLVITVSATTSGVKNAQASALHALASSVGADPGGVPASLPGVVNDAIASSAGLAADLGTWVAVAALAAAFTLAALLTLAGVTRRVTEFGTLKALGWRAGRITAQVLGEAAAVGIAGALAGVGVGFAGAALVTALGPTLTVTVIGTAAAGGPQDEPVPVHVSAPVSPGIVVLAVALGVAGGLLAGALGGWRVARLRPAAALAQVG
jgi:putative ABC transport system permease protein